MALPFTQSQFLGVFAEYNTAVWPLQFALLAAGLAAVVAAQSRRYDGTRWVLLLLAALWLWIGVVYHGIYFRRINPAALGFAVLFVTQAVLLALAAARPRGRRFTVVPDAGGVVGLVIVAYALAGYPALGYVLGHRYPMNPTFGLPCPTTLFTFGMLLWLRPPSRTLLVVPLLWSVIATSAALQLGMHEDLGLPLAALAVVVLLLRRTRAPEAALTAAGG